MLEQIESAYRWLWQNTAGKPFTDIIREDPWLLILPAAIVLGLTAWRLPRRYWARAIILYLGLGVGFVGGHVFW